MNDHPFLIKLYHAFQSNTKLYFAMEFALGGEIYTHLAKEQKFPVTQSRFYGAEIVSALGYLHKVSIFKNFTSAILTLTIKNYLENDCLPRP